ILKKMAEERLSHVEKKAEARHGYVVTQKVDSKIDPRVVTFHDPEALVSEQYKTLRTNIQSMIQKRNLKSFVVTSAIHGEGKTVTAANLAFALAGDLNAKSVVLVDGDLRKGSLTRLLGIDPKAGLSDYLSDGIELSGALLDIGVKNLSVLPAGKPPKNPSELLGSIRMRELIQELRGKFDLVIFDSPPIMNVTDPSVLGAQNDGIFMVVQAGRTQRGIIQHALRLLEHARVRTLGYVMTNVEYHLPEYIYRYVEGGPYAPYKLAAPPSS
ncbi:MAG: CpsD/CapB family tyrosine-protein kinase, partial [Candidatus Omnitrophota bacterium]